MQRNKCSTLLTKHGCEADGFHLRTCSCPHWQYQLKALPPPASTTVPTAFWFVPRLEHNQEFNLALAGKKENWVWVLFCFSVEQGKSPKPFTATSPAVLSWATYLTALVRSENRGWQQEELTQDDCPKLPGAELWHPVATASSKQLGLYQNGRASGRAEISFQMSSPVCHWPCHWIHELLQSPML